MVVSESDVQKWRTPAREKGAERGTERGTAIAVPALNGDTGEDPNLNWETVTPALATAWLNRGGRNRHINTRRVDAFAAAIRRGEWRKTGEAIKLDDQGAVRDGQHRLRAIVKAGIPIRTVVVRGVEEAAFDVMDTGRSRSVADVLGIHDFERKNQLSAAVRSLMLYERFGEFEPRVREASQIITPVTVLKYLQLHPDTIQGIQLGSRVKNAGLMGGVGTWGALFTLFNRRDSEAAHLFAHHLITGEDLSEGHPVLLLRSRFLWRPRTMGKAGSSPADRQQIAAVTIKAWNAFREGRTVRNLFWRGTGDRAQAFPQVE